MDRQAQAKALRLRMYVLCSECARLIDLADGNNQHRVVDSADLDRHESEEHAYWLEVTRYRSFESSTKSSHSQKWRSSSTLPSSTTRATCTSVSPLRSPRIWNRRFCWSMRCLRLAMRAFGPNRLPRVDPRTGAVAEACPTSIDFCLSQETGFRSTSPVE